MRPMTCPFCFKEMEVFSRNHFVSSSEFVTVYHCDGCRMGIRTVWSIYSLDPEVSGILAKEECE